LVPGRGSSIVEVTRFRFSYPRFGEYLGIVVPERQARRSMGGA
jgi:hypothetical protein